MLAPVMNYDQLIALLRDKAATLSPQLRRAAMALEAHRDDVALLSMRELARQCELPPATFSRLARTLGFDDFAALRAICVEQVRAQADGFAQRASTLAPGDAATPDEVEPAGDMRRIGQAIATHLDAAFSADHAPSLERAAQVLHGARRVVLLGARSCLALTHFLGYATHLFDDKVIVSYGAGNTMADPLRFVEAGDAVLAVTFDPYTREIIESMAYARARGATLIFLTDSALAPGADAADVVLLAPVAIPSFFHSLAAPLALLDALVLRWFRLAGPAALERLAQTDTQLRQARAYVRAPRRGALSD
ncbi:RpiR family transcriptional regulator [Pandoraea thiooxydans]|nr:MurR/RpiR family transcriptional regulator [Pandoraea thiooxydans]APR97153.1 RpiR family transcriptional regulator [Pandoraea thiooxydans]